eukprot:TRINITY_DN15568_c0_g1_i1.p1 TRINITY_DN15568_c0_g1~~TRINITY_DN15568_c0_g1_i1.p1  ORF type:complete len:280 (-),score=34.03 TRINITY_DN15568_c0_g1_i1:5-778(-)
MKKVLLGDIRKYDRKGLNEVDKNIRGEKIVVSKGKSYGGLNDDEDKTEYFDTEEELKEKIKKLAEYVRNCKYMVSYTGAGISTSANIPDYRGPNGLWTLKEKGESAKSVNIRKANPTVTHMALVGLANSEILKYVVTTNVDGLHLKSGLSPAKHCELHGNMFRGNTVGFGSELPPNAIKISREHSSKCDLALVLGTSMRVSPACNLPESSYKNGGHLVICNLQTTPYDKYASLVIRARTDYVMELLMNELGIKIPVY